MQGDSQTSHDLAHHSLDQRYDLEVSPKLSSETVIYNSPNSLRFSSYSDFKPRPVKPQYRLSSRKSYSKFYSTQNDCETATKPNLSGKVATAGFKSRLAVNQIKEKSIQNMDFMKRKNLGVSRKVSTPQMQIFMAELRKKAAERNNSLSNKMQSTKTISDFMIAQNCPEREFRNDDSASLEAPVDPSTSTSTSTSTSISESPYGNRAYPVHLLATTGNAIMSCAVDDSDPNCPKTLTNELPLPPAARKSAVVVNPFPISQSESHLIRGWRPVKANNFANEKTGPKGTNGAVRLGQFRFKVGDSAMVFCGDNCHITLDSSGTVYAGRNAKVFVGDGSVVKVGQPAPKNPEHVAVIANKSTIVGGRFCTVYAGNDASIHTGRTASIYCSSIKFASTGNKSKLIYLNNQ